MRLGVLATLSKPEVLRMGNPIPPAERFAPDLVWSWLHRIEGQ